MKRALVSVSDKSGLINFLKPLITNGLKLVSTGGTLKYLKENNLEAVDISSVTGFPEVLDGRVKTLHPFVHMGLLADTSNSEHLKQLEFHKVAAFDLVIGNLYPFEMTALNPDSTEAELIENIDIGGPSFLRSSAKNYRSVVVLSDPDDYGWVQKKILDNSLTGDDRKKLALKVFSLTSYYDSLIVQKLAADSDELKYLNLPLRKKAKLRYGENAHQQATWYENPLAELNLAKAQILQGKELSYNNILDLDAAASLVCQFSEPTCVAVKHNNPCAVAQANLISSALEKVIQSDPKSIFGGILALNMTFDSNCCQLIKDLFLECIIAPNFSVDALELLKVKKNLRLLKWPEMLQSKKISQQLKSVAGGLLQQDADEFETGEWSLDMKPENSSTRDLIRLDMKFGEIVCGYLKSNSIAIVYRGQTLGLGMGQVNRVDAVQQALLRYSHFKANNSVNESEVVLVSDAFFPFADSIKLIAEHKIKWILQPGGSTRDSEVIQAAKDFHVNMVLTHQRHFRH